MDLNHRQSGYEPVALPLSYRVTEVYRMKKTPNQGGLFQDKGVTSFWLDRHNRFMPQKGFPLQEKKDHQKSKEVLSQDSTEGHTGYTEDCKAG